MIPPSARLERLPGALRTPPPGRKRPRAARPVGLASRKAPKTNFTAQLTSFVGRQPELNDVKRLLGGSRLVTLTGPGGVGKTRLAQEVAAELVGLYAGGIWLVELAPWRTPSSYRRR